jgi:signal transduction histidine kinase
VTGIAHAPTAGDPALVERLIANLLDNAVRYNVPGCRVEISTRSRATRPSSLEQPATITASKAASGHGVLLMFSPRVWWLR